MREDSYDTNVPSIAAIGLVSWDSLLLVQRYPAAGDYEIVEETFSLPGGTTSNMFSALARLGADVSLRAVVGDDALGQQMLTSLREFGVDTSAVTIREASPTDASTIVISRDPADRTIYWHIGAAITKHDPLDIDHLFGRDVVILDIADAPLRRFLTDLPAHTRPAVRMLGTLTYLVDSGEPDELEVALRFDTLAGNEREFRALTGLVDADAAFEFIASRFRGSNLRTCVMSRGAAGCRIATTDEDLSIPAFHVDTVDTTGAGDAFAAGIAWGMALRWSWLETGRFANALGALATRAVGAQSALPTMHEVATLLSTAPPILET